MASIDYFECEDCGFRWKDQGPLFFFLNSYTGGLSPTILNYMVKSCIAPKDSGTIFTEEIGIKVTKRDVILPCGNTTIWMK